MPPCRRLTTTSTDITEVRGGAYTKEEDNRILELYKLYSTENNKWKLIASEIKRGHKSVRERYVNHLDPEIDKSDLTTQEKNMIDELQSIYMKKWAEIAKVLSNNRKEGRRTELQVKNYWNSKHRTNHRNKNKSYERIIDQMKLEKVLN